MELAVTRLGTVHTVEVNESEIYDFGGGLGGFQHLRHYALLPEPDSSVEWLQSVDDPSVAFALLEPFIFYPEYSFELSDTDTRELDLRGPEEAVVRCILTIGERSEQTTANLVAPVVLNPRARLGRQVLLQDSSLQVRFAIFEEMNLAVAS